MASTPAGPVVCSTHRDQYLEGWNRSSINGIASNAPQAQRKCVPKCSQLRHVSSYVRDQALSGAICIRSIEMKRPEKPLNRGSGEFGVGPAYSALHHDTFMALTGRRNKIQTPFNYQLTGHNPQDRRGRDSSRYNAPSSTLYTVPIVKRIIEINVGLTSRVLQLIVSTKRKFVITKHQQTLSGSLDATYQDSCRKHAPSSFTVRI